MVSALSVELQAHTVHLGGGSGPTPRVESGPLFEVWSTLRHSDKPGLKDQRTDRLTPFSGAGGKTVQRLKKDKRALRMPSAFYSWVALVNGWKASVRSEPGI